MASWQRRGHRHRHGLERTGSRRHPYNRQTGLHISALWSHHNLRQEHEHLRLDLPSRARLHLLSVNRHHHHFVRGLDHQHCHGCWHTCLPIVRPRRPTDFAPLLRTTWTAPDIGGESRPTASLWSEGALAAKIPGVLSPFLSLWRLSKFNLLLESSAASGNILLGPLQLAEKVIRSLVAQITRYERRHNASESLQETTYRSLSTPNPMSISNLTVSVRLSEQALPQH
jgi:hypothetical protein